MTTTTADAPSPEELRGTITRDLMAHRLTPRDVLDAIPTGDVRNYLAELDSTEPVAALMAEELLANLPGDVVARYAHKHNLREPGNVGDIFDRLPVYDQHVVLEAVRIREQRAAKALVDAEERGVTDLPRMVGLGDFLAEPDPDVAYRVEGLWPGTGGSC